MRTKIKVVISGDIVETYKYEEPVFYGFEAPEKHSDSDRVKTQEEKDLMKARSLYRTRKNLTRLINANARQWSDPDGKIYQPKFITLTFAENITDLEQGNKMYTNFLKRFNYYLTGEKTNHLKYVTNPEFQKRGAEHFHSVYFNLHWFDKDELAKIWEHGFIKIRNIEQVRNIGLYMTKYMSKDFIDPRLEGHKRYFPSRNLFRPIVIRDEVLASKIEEKLNNIKPEFSKEIDTDYQGKIQYEVMNLSELSDLKEDVIGFINKSYLT